MFHGDLLCWGLHLTIDDIKRERTHTILNEKRPLNGFNNKHYYLNNEKAVSKLLRHFAELQIKGKNTRTHLLELKLDIAVEGKAKEPMRFGRCGVKVELNAGSTPAYSKYRSYKNVDVSYKLIRLKK